MKAQVCDTVKQQQLIEHLLGIKLTPLESAAFYILEGKLYPCIVDSYLIGIEEHKIEVQYGIKISKQNIPYCYRNNGSFHEFVDVESVVLFA